MRETSELKATILDAASELFAKNGYAATSIKQIAKASGCTSAALYYHFEGGKAHILREVVRSYSTDAVSAVDDNVEFEHLSAYLEHLSHRIGQTMPKMRKRLSWLALELHNLPAEERHQFIDQFLGLQRAIRARLEHYLKDHQHANLLAWVIICAFFGYGQLFQTMGLEDPSGPGLDEFGQALMGIIVQGGIQE
jgi:AcrR family transcriptional regulator